MVYVVAPPEKAGPVVHVQAAVPALYEKLAALPVKLWLVPVTEVNHDWPGLAENPSILSVVR